LLPFAACCGTQKGKKGQLFEGGSPSVSAGAARSRALPVVAIAKGQEKGDVELANAGLVMNDA
jgi:hypothetical protein